LASSAQTATIVRGPYLVYPGENTGMIVMWQTDARPHSCRVRWGSTAECEFSSKTLNGSQTGAARHQFVHRLSGLAPGRRHHDLVEVDGVTAPGSFLAAPGPQERATLYAYGDTRSSKADHGKVCAGILQDLGGNGFRDGESSGKPTLQARLAYKRPLFGKYEGEVGLWAHRAWIDTETPTGASLARDFDSYAAGLDVTLPLYKNLVNLRGEIWAGQNLSDVRGGILQGINATTGREVEATGGWVELGLRPHPRFSFHAGLSVDDPDDGDLAGLSITCRCGEVIELEFAREEDLTLPDDTELETEQFDSTVEPDQDQILVDNSQENMEIEDI